MPLDEPSLKSENFKADLEYLYVLTIIIICCGAVDTIKFMVDIFLDMGSYLYDVSTKIGIFDPLPPLISTFVHSQYTVVRSSQTPLWCYRHIRHQQLSCFFQNFQNKFQNTFTSVK